MPKEKDLASKPRTVPGRHAHEDSEPVKVVTAEEARLESVHAVLERMDHKALRVFHELMESIHRLTRQGYVEATLTHEWHTLAQDHQARLIKALRLSGYKIKTPGDKPPVVSWDFS